MNFLVQINREGNEWKIRQYSFEFTQINQNDGEMRKLLITQKYRLLLFRLQIRWMKWGLLVQRKNRRFHNSDVIYLISEFSAKIIWTTVDELKTTDQKRRHIQKDSRCRREGWGGAHWQQSNIGMWLWQQNTFIGDGV